MDDFNQIVTVVVPGTVKHIGERAFADCRNLDTITLSEGLESIGDDAFSDCKKLTVCATDGSCVEQYVKEYGIPFLVTM